MYVQHAIDPPAHTIKALQVICTMYTSSQLIILILYRPILRFDRSVLGRDVFRETVTPVPGAFAQVPPVR